jgi:ABC-type multidrug transport system ATPase subunit
MDNPPLSLVPDLLVAENVFLSIGGKDILKGVTIRADKGSITGLLGRNGAGKSTMLQSVFGTRAAQECDVFLNGIKVRKPYAIDGLLNYLPQKKFLPPGLTLRKIAKQFDVDTNEISEWLPDLAEDIDKKTADLSGGRERLFSVLMLLLTKTRFTFLDEPFSHITPLHVEQLKTLLVKQKEKKGIIITDHMYRHLLEVSDKIYLVKEGKSLYIRERENLVLHGYIRDYAG